MSCLRYLRSLGGIHPTPEIMTTGKTVDLIALTSDLIIDLNKVLASYLRSYKILINRDGVMQFHKLLSCLAKARH